MGDCYDRIREMFDEEEMPDSVLKEFDRLLDRLREAGDPTGSRAAFKEKVNAEIARLKNEHVQDRMLRISQRRAQKELITRAKQGAFDGNPGEAGLAIVGGSDLPLRGATEVAHLRTASIRDLHTNVLEGGIDRIDGARRILEEGILDREIAEEMFNYGTDAAGKSGSSMAVQIAKLFKAFNDGMIREVERAYGFSLGRVDNFITKTIHSPEKLVQVGKEKWVRDFYNRIDKVKSFGPLDSTNEAFMLKKLGESYDKIVEGGDSEIRSRSYHFKSGTDFFEYNKEYGGGNLLEMSRKRVDRVARTAALVEFFGPEPKKGLETLLTFLERQEGGKEGADWRWDKKANYIRSLFEEVSGTNSLPGLHTGYVVTEGVKAFNVATYLNNVGIRGFFGNLASGAAEVAASQGGNVFARSFDLVKEMSRLITPAQAKAVAEQFDFFLQDFRNGVVSDFRGLKDLISNKTQSEGSQRALETINASQRLVFKYVTWIDAVQNRTRLATSNVLAQGVREMADGGYDLLDARQRANLSRAGIDRPQLELLAFAQETDPFGRKLTTPRALRLVDIDRVKEIMASNGIKGRPEDFLMTTYHRYAGYLSSAVQVATTSAGPRANLLLRLGYARDTNIGALLGLVTQFKSFSLQQLSVMRRLYTADPAKGATQLRTLSPVYLEDWKLKAGLPKGDVWNTASAASMMAATWLAGQQMIRVFRGQDVEDLSKEETWANAFLKGGAMGVLGDFVDSEAKRGRTGLGGYVIGPTGTRVADALGLFGDYVADRNADKKTSAFLTSMVPFQNHIILQHAMKPLIIDQIRASLDPDYEERQRRRELRASLED